MKRVVLMLVAVAAMAGMAFGSPLAQVDAGPSYPPGPLVVASPDPVSPGQTVILSMAHFCGPTVSIAVTGPETRLFPTASFPAFGFTAPNTPGTYTVTVTGNTEPCPVAVQGLINATASTTFTVVLPGSSTTAPTTAPTTPTTAAATSTTAATPTTAAATTTTAVGSAGPVTTTTAAPVLTVPSGVALPVTGSNNSATLQIALAFAAGGAMLLIVARARRQQRAA